MAATLRTAFGQIGFSADAAMAITADQDIDSTAKLRGLDDTEVENLCKII